MKNFIKKIKKLLKYVEIDPVIFELLPYITLVVIFIITVVVLINLVQYALITIM